MIFESKERGKPMNRPKSLKQLWSEEDLCRRLGLRKGKGHSLALSHWIRRGLRCIEISDKRFFWEHEIVNFLSERLESLETKGKGDPNEG